MKATIFTLAVLASATAHAGIPVPATCEDFSGTYSVNCNVTAKGNAIAPVTAQVSKALGSGQVVSIQQGGCAYVVQSGVLASIGGLDMHSVEIPVPNQGSAKLGYIHASSWQANNTELKTTVLGMIQIGGNEAIPFKANTQVKRVDAGTLEATGTGKAATSKFDVSCVYKKQ